MNECCPYNILSSTILLIYRFAHTMHFCPYRLPYYFARYHFVRQHLVAVLNAAIWLISGRPSPKFERNMFSFMHKRFYYLFHVR